jgi:hypothetical protein
MLAVLPMFWGVGICVPAADPRTASEACRLGTLASVRRSLLKLAGRRNRSRAGEGNAGR